MFEKTKSINTKGLSILNQKTQDLENRLFYLPDGSVTVINNSDAGVKLVNITKEGSFETVSFQDDYSSLVSVKYFNNAYWLEFHDIMGLYNQEYSLFRATKSATKHVVSLPRESYQSDMPYHYLFSKNDQMFLRYIRHNRLHHYAIGSNDSFLEEIDVIEGGNWYLCDEYSLCHIRDVIEIYNSELNICSTIEYEGAIDEINYALASTRDMLAVTLADVNQEQTTLIIADDDTTSISYIESTIANMGLSGGKAWLNPYSFQEHQDLGGCMVYDRYAWPLYIHMRSKSPHFKSIGAYPPPFHRSERILPLANGLTLVAENTRIIIFDFACRPVQEIPIVRPDYFAINKDGSEIAILNVNREDIEREEWASIEEATIDFYSFNKNSDGSKVIEMAKFTR